MPVKKYLEDIERDFEALLTASFMTFEEVKKLKKVMGVYCVYFQKEIIYIGSTNKFDVRFGADLLHLSTHTLHRKLLKDGKTTAEVRRFLKSECQYRILVCQDKLQAEALEHLAIWIIKPKYNKYIYCVK